ncbi:MAG: signal transduction histidine kinase [Bacteroidetes bacterium]|nr:signal transduction histidine kinase [Bacteroidota bacterium]
MFSQPQNAAGTGRSSGKLRAHSSRTWNHLLIVAAVLALVPAMRAQEKIVFQHLTVKDGLSQGGVNCILQDRQGFVWFGTQDGLNRYDGQAFVIYRHDASDSTSLDDSWIISIIEDSSGTLWVRTQNSPGMLNRLDRATGKFTLIPRDSLQEAGARRNSVKPGFMAASGVRWSGDLGEGVTRFDPATGKNTVYKHDPRNPKSLIDDKVYSIYGDSHGTIWIGTKEGLDRFDAKTETFIHHKHEASDPNSLSDNWVWPILEDRSGVLWVGTYNGGLNRFDRSTGKFTRFKHDESDPRSLGGNQLYSLYQDRSGLIWVGMNDHGVDTFHPELGGFVHVAHDPSKPGSLLDNNILGMYADRTGAVWVGTRGGLDRFDRAKGTFTHFKNEPANPRSIGQNLVQCLFEDRSGTLWIGTVSNGLDRFDRKSGTFTHYRNDPANPNSLSDNRVYALCEDKNGAIWIGTYRGGLNKFDPATGTFTRYVHSDSIPGSLGARGVFALLEDREGTLWVGTFGGGLDRFERNSNAFTHFRHDPADNASLSDDLVASLHEDRAGTLWVGTTGGLNRFDRSTGKFKPYRVKDGLPNDVIFGILEDGNGHLWLSTNKGLSRFDPQRQTFSNYDYNDGLQGDEFNQNAFARDPRTGEMYFGGSNGFNYFQPDNVRDNPYIPQISFVAFTRYNTDDKEGKPIAEGGMDVKPQITLSYKDNVANFEFAALSFYNSSNNEYAYKLDGFSDNWIQLGTQRKATFTNLEGGEYLLRVKGSNNDGVWNDQGAVLRLIVNPPWWKTWWAYGGYAVMVFGLLYSLRRFELNRREQKARVRESELRAKAAEAEKRALQAENERKTKELEDARMLQLSMLPRDVPRLPKYDIAVFMKTATEVGGDYYDFSVAEDGTLNVAFGDATGHGMQAGTIVTLMKGLFLSDASRFEIQAFFNHCSRAIKEIRLGRLFMAFTLVRLKGNSVYLSSAGMPPVYLYRKSSRQVEEILLKGMPLGAMKNFPYALHEASLEKGDTLLLLTDGLPEQKNAAGEMFDYTRVKESFTDIGGASPDDIIAHLMNKGEEWMRGAIQDDDITMLVVKVKE